MKSVEYVAVSNENPEMQIRKQANSTLAFATDNSMTIECERCGRTEVVDYPENEFDFQYKYGFRLCQDCMTYWVDPRNELLQVPDQWAARGKRR